MATEGGRSRAPDDTQQAHEDSSAGDFLRELAFAPPAAPPAPTSDRIGERLGRFQLAELLGRGGMGEVYAALDLTLRRKVALKLLRAEAVGSEERQRRFVREARAAAAVSHPNIAAVFEVGEVAGEVFLAFELIEGHSLRASLDRAGVALPESEAARIAREIARGLAAAHKAGIIHRDVKPENVMLGQDGCVKILDFGIAKLHGAPNEPDAPTASAVTTRAGRILGSPSYMAPEQARGLPTDTRSDVFSLGVVLFEMLAGARPFRGPTTMDVLTAILRDKPPTLPGVPGALAGVVARCLAKEPSERYADAGALLAALEAVAPPEAPPAEHPSSPRRSPRLLFPAATMRLPPRLRPWVAAAVVASVASAAAWLSDQAPEPPTTSRTLLSPPPAPRPTAITDLPPPTSHSAEAVTNYQAALRSFRSADWGQAESSLSKAVGLDPNLASAHLRLAIVQSTSISEFSFNRSPTEVNAIYSKVARLQDGLPERERSLFEALEPAMRLGPLDMAEAVRRLERLTERYPFDAEIWQLLAIYRSFDTPGRQLEAARRAVELDPGYADAWELIGLALASKDAEAETAAYERCTAIVPTAPDCWRMRAIAESRRGRCDDASGYLGRTKDESKLFLRRADLLYALGKPRKAVLQALKQTWAQPDPGGTPQDQSYDRALLAAAYGDFAEARQHARQGQAQVSPRQPLGVHGRFAVLLADIELEAGQEREAAKIASEFLQRRDGFRGLDGPMTTPDPTVYLERVAVRGRAGAEAELRAKRDAWYRAGKPSTPLENARAWWFAYTLGIKSEGEALEALEARPANAPWSTLYYWMDESTGLALWFGGKHDEALPHLERAFRRCSQFSTILPAMRTNLLYGRALEEKGDHEGACEVYGSILKRWGEAKPRSVTAEEARRHAATLDCGAARRQGGRGDDRPTRLRR